MKCQQEYGLHRLAVWKNMGPMVVYAATENLDDFGYLPLHPFFQLGQLSVMMRKIRPSAEYQVLLFLKV